MKSGFRPLHGAGTKSGTRPRVVGRQNCPIVAERMMFIVFCKPSACPYIRARTYGQPDDTA